jgi:hypothetical protein
MPRNSLTDLTNLFLKTTHKHAYSRNMCPVWQIYPLGSGEIPYFNWDFCGAIPEVDTQVHKLQKAYITPCLMSPDP